MDALQKSLLAVVAISLFLPIVQAEDKFYRIEGLPENLHYSTGKSYEIVLTANDYASISEVNISVLRSPEIVSHSTSGVPDWANSLAWAGVSITVLCSVAGSYVLRRDKIKQ